RASTSAASAAATASGTRRRASPSWTTARSRSGPRSRSTTSSAARPRPAASAPGTASASRSSSRAARARPRTTAGCWCSPTTSLDQLSGGRFLLGLGVSGPQVVEGWHGQPFGKPLTRTREYVEIVRAIWARERPLEHQGEHYQIPYRGPGATGLGKPLRSILHGRQIPIYVAATRPKSVAQAAEIADGWLAVWYSPYRTGFYRDAL